MLDLIEFIISIFTEPIMAVLTVVILLLFWGGSRLYARNQRRNYPVGTTPEEALQIILKFTDEELEENQNGHMSESQLQRLRREFRWQTVFAGIMFLIMIGVVAYFSIDIATSRYTSMIFKIGFIGGLGAFVLFMGFISWLFYSRYRLDIQEGAVSGLPIKLDFQQHYGEHMAMQIPTRQFNLTYYDETQNENIDFRIGFLSEVDLALIFGLTGKSAVLYITPRTQKILSFEVISDALYETYKERLRLLNQIAPSE